LAEEWCGSFLGPEHYKWLGSKLGGEQDEIVLSTSGLEGDCGSEAPWLELLNGRDYEGALTRSVRRGVSRVTITPVGHFMSFAYGVMNTCSLPPFAPVGRNQDGVFAAMVKWTRPYALACHLPVYVRHEAKGWHAERRYRDVVGAVKRGWRTNDFVGLIFATRLGARPRCLDEAAQILRRVGTALTAVRLGVISDEYDAYTAIVSAAAARWASTAGPVGRWRVERALRAVRRPVVPWEWRSIGWEACGQYLLRLAEALDVWDEVTAGFRETRWVYPWTGLSERDGVVRCGA
jgi:hypothetical protein